MLTGGRHVVYRDASQGEVELPPQRRRSALDRLAWDSLRMLLALADAGSFRSGAAAAGVALNTMRSKIDRLESQFGTALFIRSVEGVRLTQEGHELAAIARQMETIGHSAQRVQLPLPDRMPSRVRITVTEGLGTFWLVPRMVEFCAAYPDTGIDLSCDAATPAMLFRDSDVAILWDCPPGPGLVCEHVASVHVMPFATDVYFARKGRPASLADAHAHDLVWQNAEHVTTDALSTVLSAADKRPTIVLTTNTSSAHYWAVARGAGIGFLPTYAAAFDPMLRPIDIGVHIKRDVYLAHHPQSSRIAEVTRALDWVRSSFAATRFPWFGPDFVHPERFAAMLAPADVALFEGLTAV